MTTRREFLLGVGGVLFLTSGTQAQPLPNKTTVTTPAEVVQQYLTARAAGDYALAYSQLSTASHQQIPFAQFAGGEIFPDAAAHAAEDGVSPLMEAVSILFMDSHNAMGYRFTVLGPDPADPHTTQVRAMPAETPPTNAFLLRIVTTPDAGGIPRIEIQPSYQKTNPADFERMRQKASANKSASNLKTIALGVYLYIQDHHNRLPDAERWVDQIYPYVRNEAMFHAPSAPTGQQWTYAFNRDLSGLRFSALKNPATTVLVFESTTGVKNASNTGESVPHPGWYRGGSYYAFADGHIKWISDENDPALLKTWLSFSPQGAAPSP